MASCVAEGKPSPSSIPQASIKSVMDLGRWKMSTAYKNYMGFLHSVNQAVMSRKTTDSVHIGETVEKLLTLLDTVKHWTDDIPLEEMGSQRFGNKAYRKWYAKLNEEADSLMEGVLPEEKKNYAAELGAYLRDSFGNSTRIDYGTGHEACFLILLLCLYRLELITERDLPAVGLKVVREYLRVCRHLQATYNMEPAGSRGVHAIDDYQFVPFLWGSAQLVGTSVLPDHFVNPEMVAKDKELSLFLEAVDYINQTKTGPFHEHSNQLWNISAVQKWDKINGGLFKMYEAEVLAKFPVIQHFKFGALFSL